MSRTSWASSASTRSSRPSPSPCATGSSSRHERRTPCPDGLREPARSGSGRLPPSFRAPFDDAPLALLRRRPGIVSRVLAADVAASLGVAPLVVQEGTTPRTATLLREQRLE